MIFASGLERLRVMNWVIKSPDISTISQVLSIPTASENKYSRGVLGVIAGSDSFPGAAILNISAAIHTGVGLVRYLGGSALVKEMILKTPEVVLSEGKVDGYLIGSGIDPNLRSSLIENRIRTALKTDLPAVIDAGALDLAVIGRKYQLLIPHAGELARLLQRIGVEVSATQINDSPAEFAQLAATKFASNVLLKGNTTYVACYSSSTIYQIADLNPWLATAGTGDVLAGVISALLVQQSELTEHKVQDCAAMAVLIHSDAAGLASKGGPIAASEIPQLISNAIAHYLSNDFLQSNLQDS